MGRKTQTWEQISTDSIAGKQTLLSQNDYNELGQLQNKHLHSTDTTDFLQDVNYAYNERGWLLFAGAPLFEESLQYNYADTTAGISVPQYNGNIAIQNWGTNDNPDTKSFVYRYDRLNRLTSGITIDSAFAERGISYDQGGNINNLSRVYGGTLIDSMLYRYNGNQLQSIRDVSPDISKNGYPAGNGNYFYDGNGNMNRVLTKEGTGSYTTSYNILNLPDTVTTPHGTVIYTYDAAGEKLNKTSTIDSVTTTTDYISGIQYTNGKLAFIQTEEGRALPDSGTFNYEYTLADHLGNSRLSFTTKGDSITVIQEDDYMPFGMEISGEYKSPKNEYLYNKKELQEETNLYDYGARFYDPLVARWTSIDPLAEISRKWSPYNYVENDPIRNTDLDGMSYQDGIYENGLYGNTVIYSASESEQEQPPKKKSKADNRQHPQTTKIAKRDAIPGTKKPSAYQIAAHAGIMLTAAEANTGFGVAPYKAGTFVREFEAQNLKGFVRVFSKGTTKMEGQWIMKAEDIEGLTPQEIQSKFSLPNTPDHVSDVEIPNGTVIREGEASAAYNQNGGGVQYQLKGRASFNNPRALETTILPMENTNPVNPEEFEPLEPIEPIEPIIP